MNRFRLNMLSLVFALLGVFLFNSPKNVLAGEASSREEVGEKTFTFRWAFGAMVGSKDDRRLVAITRDMALKSGDQIKIFLELQKKCYVYVIYHSPQGEIVTLFPHRFDQLDKDSFASGGYYIPKGDGWFELDDHAGEEKFYLLASSVPLRRLEDLINHYETTDQAKKPEIATQIIAKIHELRWQNRNFKIFAEKPVNILGQVRGTDKDGKASSSDVARFAVEISAKNFFSKAFTIDHR